MAITQTTPSEMTAHPPLHVSQVGHRGAPLVFLHGMPLDSRCWLYQMAHLSTWFEAIGIDMPGYGHSPAWGPPFTLSDVAEACWRAVDLVSGQPAILCGVSMGGDVALRMASQRPERTRALVLTGYGYLQVK